MAQKTFYNLTTDIPVDDIPFNRYPRPQLRRKEWINLNGRWECGVNVPFPLQSVNSGFEGKVPEEYVYFRTFDLKIPKKGRRVLLHFGAVDQVCKVYVDDMYVGYHEGGYLPFCLDITDALADKLTHILKVDVTDTLSIIYPYGKQSNNRGGMWYTPVSGIWQTVWIEIVPEKYIKGIKITPHLKGIELEVDSDNDDYKIEIFDADIYGPVSEDDRIPTGNKSKIIISKRAKGPYHKIEIPKPKLWDVDHPYLYGIRITSGEDTVESYFALRRISIVKDKLHRRICLNRKPFFFHAVLDQGYYPEGIFLPNSERGYEEDILNMKKLGFNSLRKHIKIEPACFYEACDRIGMVVMQDMVNNSDYNFLRDTVFPTAKMKTLPDHFLHKDPESRAFFIKHMEDTVEYLYNFPCICYYTIFNEGWGQFDSDKMYTLLKSHDKTRIVDSTSGWFTQLKSDVWSRHVYFHPVSHMMHVRPIIVSEFGGYSYVEKGHTFNFGGNYAYKEFQSKAELSVGIKKMYERDIVPYISKGLCGAVLTQLSDVEDETNGVYTYDRKVLKFDPEIMDIIAREIKEEEKKISEGKNDKDI